MTKTKLSLLTLLFAGVLAFAVTLTVSPESVEAGQCLPCNLGTPITTAPVTVGSPVDCPWAVKKAKNQLLAQASCADGFCVKEFITDSFCVESDPNHLVTMRLRYKCLECISFPDP